MKDDKINPYLPKAYAESLSELTTPLEGELEARLEEALIRIEAYKAELDWIDSHLFKDVATCATREFIKEDTPEARRLLRLCDLRDMEWRYQKLRLELERLIQVCQEGL